jgi:hypothetical protein
VLLIPHAESLTSDALSPARALFQLNSIQTNIISTNAQPNDHVRCKSIFNTYFSNNPRWIDPATTLCIATQNVQGFNPFRDANKLQGGTSNMVSLQSGIMCFTETNVEWPTYIFRQAYKNAFIKLCQSSRPVFCSSSKISQSSYQKRGGTVISAADR